MTDGTSYNTHNFSHLHFCQPDFGCYMPLIPPEGFEEWFFSQHGIERYDCGEESTANDLRVNEFNHVNGFAIPYSNCFNFKETRKPKFNEFAYPLQHQRYSDSFWLMHVEGLRDQDLKDIGPLIAYLGQGVHGGNQPEDQKHKRIEFPHGAFWIIRQVYSLQDIPERFASVFYREEEFPFDSSTTKDSYQRDQVWNLSTRNSSSKKQAQEGHILVFRITDDRFNLANSLAEGYQQTITSNPDSVNTFSGGEAYYTEHFTEGYHPDINITPSSLTVNPYAAAGMSKGQIFDLMSYANGILGFRGMSLNLKQYVQSEGNNSYVTSREFRAPLLESAKLDYAIKTLKNNNNYVAWDELLMTFHGFNYFDRLLGSRYKNSFRIRSLDKVGTKPASRQNVLWKLGHRPNIYTMFGGLYDIDREDAAVAIERHAANSDFLNDKLSGMMAAQLYCRQTDGCDWSMTFRVKSKNQGKWWYEVMLNEINQHHIPIPETMYISNQSIFEMDHYGGQGSFTEHGQEESLKLAFLDIDIVACHENLLPTHVPIMPPTTIFDETGTAAFDNGREMLVKASDFYDSTNTRITTVPLDCVEKATNGTEVEPVMGSKIVTEIDTGVFVSSVLPSTDADYANLTALLVREKAGHKFYAIQISCTP